MSWEAVSALGSLLSATVIAITVIFASRQVKVGARQAQLTNDQLNHLRRSTQLEGAMRIFDEMDKTEFREAVRFVVHDLAGRMQDPAFRSGVAFPEAASDALHKENIVMRFFERVGAYVKEGLLDGSLIYTVVPTTILSTWEALKDVITIQRETVSELKAENFEFLYQGTLAWSKEHGYAFQPFSEQTRDAS